MSQLISVLPQLRFNNDAPRHLESHVRGWRALKFLSALFPANCSENNYRNKDDGLHHRHRERIIWLPVGQSESLREPSLLLRGIRGREIAQLIYEAWKRAAKLRRGEFIQVDGNDAPGTLDHELDQKAAENQQRRGRR